MSDYIFRSRDQARVILAASVLIERGAFFATRRLDSVAQIEITGSSPNSTLRADLDAVHDALLESSKKNHEASPAVDPQSAVVFATESVGEQIKQAISAHKELIKEHERLCELVITPGNAKDLHGLEAAKHLKINAAIHRRLGEAHSRIKTSLGLLTTPTPVKPDQPTKIDNVYPMAKG